MKKYTIQFIFLSFIILILNQVIFFGACFKISCITSAIPHTLFIAFIISFLLNFRRNHFKEEKKYRDDLPIKEGIFEVNEMKLIERIDKEGKVMEEWISVFMKFKKNYTYTLHLIKEENKEFINKIDKIHTVVFTKEYDKKYNRFHIKFLSYYEDSLTKKKKKEVQKFISKKAKKAEKEKKDNQNKIDCIRIERNIKYIYHMTHIKNLQNILKDGLLAHNNSSVTVRIDNKSVNERRNFKEPIYNKNVHNYVPFYFNPRNPMLYVQKDQQEKIIILLFNKKLIFKNNSLFTDGNASVRGTKFFNKLDDLTKLNWGCLRSTFWNNYPDGKRLMMSEVLVYNKVKIKHLKKIYCYNSKTKKHILNIDNTLDVEVNKEIFF